MVEVCFGIVLAINLRENHMKNHAMLVGKLIDQGRVEYSYLFHQWHIYRNNDYKWPRHRNGSSELR